MDLLDFPEDWQELQLTHITETPVALLTQVRLYLFTLKTIGFLHMRLEHLNISQVIFEKLVSLDSQNRIGAQGLLELLIKRKDEYSTKAGEVC
ncbi:MAG: hypothetical protein NTV00_02750 [Methylococcales bacterium]|nr:hypothetical protein [Methylococcales bacterium]